jgi:hypothetical protein
MPGNPSEVQSLRGRAMIMALVGAVVCVLGYLTQREHFYFAYLQSYMLWLGVTLGCMMIWMVHNMTGGLWGPKPVRKILESSFQLVPLMAILFIPILAGMHVLYSWTAGPTDPQLLAKKAYLNVPFFVVRVVIYFVLWMFFAFIFRRWRGVHPSEMALPELRRLQKWSAFGIITYVITISFAGMDWMMSIEPHWFSSAFGSIILIGQVMASFCFLVVIWRVFEKKGILGALDVKVMHDFGNFLLMSTMFWAYMSFAQYLIMWSGQLPEEMFWYRARAVNGWQCLGWGLVIFGFVIPFICLLMRKIKKTHRYLTLLALYLVAFRLVDLYWYGTPVATSEGPKIHWMNFAFPFALGAIWLTGFFGIYGGAGLSKPVPSAPQDRNPREKRN